MGQAAGLAESNGTDPPQTMRAASAVLRLSTFPFPHTNLYRQGYHGPDGTM